MLDREMAETAVKNKSMSLGLDEYDEDLKNKKAETEKKVKYRR